MKVIGHAKITKIEKTKVGDKEAHKGELSWQMPKANKEDAQEYAVMPFLLVGKSGENLSKYRNDKNGNARYFLISGLLKKGKQSMYIQIDGVGGWEFPPYEPRANAGGDGDGGGAPLPDDDPW